MTLHSRLGRFGTIIRRFRRRRVSFIHVCTMHIVFIRTECKYLKAIVYFDDELLQPLWLIPGTSIPYEVPFFSYRGY